ncbi:MAG: hypothetical protein JWQ44_1730 [Chthoniobacter sp.]|nr:hypothetical protein [Chthoniobacter sp.]
MNPQGDIIDDLRLLEAPEPWRVNYWLLGALLLLALIAWWLVRRWRAGRREQTREELMQQAHEDALAELARLFALIDEEQSRPYGIESSAIIRRYVESRFRLAAPQRSTPEFLKEAQHSPKLTAEYQALLGEFLRYCDLLKFARTFADRDELENLHAAAVHFVTETAPPPTQETAP